MWFNPRQHKLTCIQCPSFSPSFIHPSSERYAPGQFFKEHHDGRFRPAHSISVSLFLVLGPQSWSYFQSTVSWGPITVFVYLNDIPSGSWISMAFLNWLNWPPLRKQFCMCFAEAWWGWWDVFPRAQHEGAARMERMSNSLWMIPKMLVFTCSPVFQEGLV